MSLKESRGQLEVDVDDLTDKQIQREYQTWSKGYLRRHKLLSVIRGNSMPSRKKVFSEIHIDEDMKIFDITVAGRKIKCAKIYNPAVLDVKKLRSNSTSSSSSSRNDDQDEDYWSHLTSVQRLEIEDHEGIMQTFPKKLANNLPFLESLSLSWTRVRTIPEKFFQHAALRTLYLERNQIKTLSGIEQAERLTRLNVSHNCLEQLPKAIGQHLVNLVDVNLSGNQLRELPESIGSLVRLKTLDVSSNRLRSLPLSIGHVIELSSLDVSNNQLTELPPAIVHLPNLEDVRARGNRLTVLPTGFGGLTRLTSLLLRANRFTEVPAELAELPNLQNLNMGDNQIERMGRSIASLKFLVLDNNSLRSIDDAIAGCVNLQLLSVQQNRLTGVSANIDQLRGLRSLQLSGNGELTSLPSSLSRLENLSNLGLRATGLPTLPVDVALMPSLTVLDLDDCPELEGYLKLAYKENGLAGVRDYISKESTESEYATADPSAGPVMRSSRITGLDNRQSIIPGNSDATSPRSKAIVGTNRMTIMAPIGENGDGSFGTTPEVTSGKSEQLDMSHARNTIFPAAAGELRSVADSSWTAVEGNRQQKVLSIVHGQTSPIDDAITGSGSTNDYTGMKAKPPTAVKPGISLGSRQTLHPTGGTASGSRPPPEANTEVELLPISAHVEGQSEAAAVVHVYQDFGDLMTSSSDEPPPPSADRLAADNAAEESNTTSPAAPAAAPTNGIDLNELYASISRKTNKPPPVMSKPTVRFNLDS